MFKIHKILIKIGANLSQKKQNCYFDREYQKHLTFFVVLISYKKVNSSLNKLLSSTSEILR